MHIIIIALLFPVLAVQGELQECAATDQQEPQCAGYCYEVTKPLMDHTKLLYTQDESSSPSRTPDKVEELLQTKLKNLKTEIESVLQKQIDTNAVTNGDILARFEKVEVQLRKVAKNATESATTSP